MKKAIENILRDPIEILKADCAALLAEISRLGPSGAERPCEDLRKRLDDEIKELRQAAQTRSELGTLEEAADVLRYAALLQYNGCERFAHGPAEAIPRWAWKEIHRALEWLVGASVYKPNIAHRALALFALAKYYIRFVENGQRKNTHEELLAASKVVWKLYISLYEEASGDK